MPFHSVSSSICPFKNLWSLNTLSVADISLLRKSRIFHIKPSINACALGTQSINGFKQKKPHKAEIAYEVFWTLRISTFEETGVELTSAFPPHSWARPVGPRMWYTCELHFQAKQHEERKPLKEKSQKGPPKPENHYKVSRRDLLARDNPLSIRTFLFSWVSEIWNPWEKLLSVFKARYSLVNEILCLDVQEIAFFAMLEIEDRQGCRGCMIKAKSYNEKVNCLLCSLMM